MSSQKQLTEEQAKAICDQDFWFIRPCAFYKTEYKICTSLKGRFYQYFIDGTIEDCTEWKRNHSDCLRWKGSNNYHAGVKIIEAEKLRKLKRLRTRLDNDVFEERATPPDDWNAPLPDYLEEKSKQSSLSNAEIKDRGQALCTIL